MREEITNPANRSWIALGKGAYKYGVGLDTLSPRRQGINQTNIDVAILRCASFLQRSPRGRLLRTYSNMSRAR